MRKKLLRYCAALIAALMLTAACGILDYVPDIPMEPVFPATPAPEPESDAPEGATRDFVPPPGGDWTTPYGQTVLITAASIYDESRSVEGGDDINNNPWTRLYKEALNIEVEFDWVYDDDYELRLKMAIATGNLPDVFYIPEDADPQIFIELQESGMLLDLTDAYNEYTSERIRNHELADPTIIDRYTVDGRIYGIPRYHYGQIGQLRHMWVRRDWYEDAGSPAIKTVEDLEDLAKLFRREYGASYGIAVNSDLEWLFGTAPMFGAYVGNINNNEYFWMPDETGRLRPGISFPEFRTALEYWRKWYRERIIGTNFSNLDSDGLALDDVINGKVGIQCFGQEWGWWASDIVRLQGDNTYFLPMTLPTVEGDSPARAQIYYQNTGVIVASANFNNPAALMKILSINDHMVFDPDAGLSDEDYKYYIEDGREYSMTPTFRIIDPSADSRQFQHVLHAIETKDMNGLFTSDMKSLYSDALSWINAKDPGGLGAYLLTGFDGSAVTGSKYLLNNDLIVKNSMWGPAPLEFGDAGNPGGVVMEGVINIITGRRNINDWPAILEKWYEQGGLTMEDAVNAHYG